MSGMAAFGTPRRDPLPLPTRDLAALVRAARGGDERAWDRLVRRFNPMLRRVIGGYRLTAAEAEDVLQITWTTAFTRLGALREPASIGAWLSTTARRTALGFLQVRVREFLTSDAFLFDGVADEDVESQVFAAERREALHDALSALPERQRSLLRLLATEENYSAISAVLAMPLGSIGPTRARALARLACDAGLSAFRA